MDEPIIFPLAKVEPPSTGPDQHKIDMVKEVLARLEAGEQCSALTIILVDVDKFEIRYDGAAFELLAASSRLMHAIHTKMDTEGL
jgi:hypothetical protein